MRVCALHGTSFTQNNEHTKKVDLLRFSRDEDGDVEEEERTGSEQEEEGESSEG